MKGAVRKNKITLNHKKNALKRALYIYKWMMLSLIDISFVQV